MNRKYGLMAMAAAYGVSLLAPAPAQSQVFTLTKEQLTEYTAAWTGERFADGRPKVPDWMIEAAKGLSQEEITIPGGRGGGGYSQYTDGWQLLQPGKKMVGRAFTVSFLPSRSDMDQVVAAKAKEKGIPTLNHQYAFDLLQPGDVLVIDMFGKQEAAPIGDNLFYYIMKATKGGGIVIDGAFRDLEGIAEFGMPAYFRAAHPSAIAGVTVSGINVPIRIGSVTVMPGDLVVGDREGVAFIPAQNVERILTSADETHIHDEWTKKKFDEGKYKSSEIYSTPRDPALRQEYQEYLKKKLAEVQAARKK
jgi:4-hydroxy-4-methyl-2-oxoglutarate aldolase